MTACKHCATEPTVRAVTSPLLGSTTVTLTLCDCDYPRCPHKACRKPLRGVPMHAHRCPHCDGPL